MDLFEYIAKKLNLTLEFDISREYYIDNIGCKMP